MDYLKYTFEDFRDQIKKSWIEFSAKAAIVRLDSNGERAVLSFGQLLEKSKAFSDLLSNCGICRAERIAVISKYSAQAVVLNFILAYSGYTAVLIDAALPAQERNRLLEFSDVSAVFTTQDIYVSIPQEQIENIPAFNIEGDFSFSKFCNSNEKRIKALTEPVNKNVIAILFSSGTTGTMKGVQITYSSILYAHKCIVKYTNLDSNAKFLDVLPQNHIAGYSSALSCSLSGAELGFISEVNAQALSRGFQDYLPTNFIMIPKIYEVIMEKIQDAISKKAFPIRWYAKFAMFLSGVVRKTTGVKLRLLTKPIYKAALGENMKICGCGTAPCSKSLIEFYLNLGIDFVNVYGATETGFPIAAANCNDKYPTQGCGNVNLFPEISVIISDPDESGTGEIRIKSPLIMNGYFKDPELTANSFDEEGFFKTGDIGYLDKNGYLYVTGRIKESIVLSNGKKVSPADVDNYYLSRTNGYDIACRGISTLAGGYDEIHLFVASDTLSGQCMEEVTDVFRRISNVAPSIYKLSGIHFIPQIPKTTVGKIKRFCLEIPEKIEQQSVIPKHKDNHCSISDIVYSQIRTIAKLSKEQELYDYMRLKEDVGMDSLQIFELCAGIDEEFCVSIEECLDDNVTIGSLLDIIKIGGKSSKSADQTQHYPVNRTQKDYKYIERFHFLSKCLWKFEVNGLSNIKNNEQYIFCPNHESLFDGIWITGFLDRGIRRNTYCLAASHLFKKRLLRKALIGMGGIPVQRSGNTSLAMKIAEERLSIKGNNLLIHPEGTRSRSGDLGEFKQGAAQLAVKQQIKIIPICIDGSYEVFPPQRKLPHLFDWKRFRKYKIRITFGEPLTPNGKNAKVLTEELRKRIVEMKINNTERRI